MKSTVSFESILKDEIESFLELRKSQGHVMRADKYMLYTLDRYLREQGRNDKCLPPDIVEGWLLSLPIEMNINTKIVYISHYAQFAKFLRLRGYMAFIPERPIDDRRYVPYVFTGDELDRLVNAADNAFATTNKSGKHGCACFSIILRILIGCGMRLNEVLLLNTSHVDLINGIISVKSAKGNKDRLVPMHDSLTNILKLYINSGIPQTDGLLFPSRNNKAFSQVWARHRFNLALLAAGIEKPVLEKYERNICIHCLRHTFAVASFRKLNLEGRDMYEEAPVLSTYMGHERIYGTEKYLHMTTENSADILAYMEKFNEGLFPEVDL